MKRLLCLLAVVLLSNPLIAQAQRGRPTTSVNATALAQQLVDQLSRGDFAAATSRFDVTMKEAMSIDALRDEWQSVLLEAGQFKKQTGIHLARAGQVDVVFVRCEFERSSLDVRVAFNQAREVKGLFFASTQRSLYYESSLLADIPAAIGPNERNVTVGSGEWALPGTLTIPEGQGPFPAVVLVHGSGPSDRDGTLFGNKPFRDLAHGLSSRGIAVLRYDKRTYAHSMIMTLMKVITVKEEVTDDVLAAVALLRKTDEVDSDRVFVLGHGLGGALLPRIAKLDRNLAGLIVMAGPARPLEDLALQQVNYLASVDGVITAEEKAQLKEARRQAAQVKREQFSSDSGLIFGAPAGYWLDLRNYDPSRTAKHLKQPILVLQGERDYQVTMDDFEMWKQALSSRSTATLKSYAELNHLFIEGEGKPGPEEYHTPGRMEQSVVNDIAEWINRQ